MQVSNQLPNNANSSAIVTFINKLTLWLKKTFNNGLTFEKHLASELVSGTTNSNQISVSLSKTDKPKGLILIDSHFSKPINGPINIVSWTTRDKKLDIVLHGIDELQNKSINFSLTFLVIYG